MFTLPEQLHQRYRTILWITFPDLHVIIYTIGFISKFKAMYPGGYTAQVTSLSPNATEKDVNDFFSHCGVVDHVEIIR